MATTQVTEVGDGDFERMVLAAETPVAVDFWAPWCPPCRVIAPILAELAGEYGDQLRIVKLNIDILPAYIGRFGIRGAPTLIVFKDGQEVDRLVGSQHKSTYQNRFDAILGVAHA
ncbi:MAG TPA: thioredoxin [Herpetosiphonaceae bacterium]|nr:thioredoxin [Herpetosiphonaceae bacterium]